MPLRHLNWTKDEKAFSLLLLSIGSVPFLPTNDDGGKPEDMFAKGTDGKGTGVFYGEPQGAVSWSRYPLNAWGDNGRPTKAMDAFTE